MKLRLAYLNLVAVVFVHAGSISTCGIRLGVISSNSQFSMAGGTLFNLHHMDPPDPGQMCPLSLRFYKSWRSSTAII